MYEITWRFDASSDKAAEDIFAIMKQTMDAVRGNDPGAAAPGVKLAKIMDE